MLITCARLHPAAVGRAAALAAAAAVGSENPLVHTPPAPPDHSLSVSHARDALGFVHEEPLLAQELVLGPQGLADRGAGRTLGQVSQLELSQVRLECGSGGRRRKGLPAPVGT